MDENLRFKDGVYYFIVSIFSISICYIFIFKTELLTANRILISALSPIIILIIRQLYNNMETFSIRKNTFMILLTILGGLTQNIPGILLGFVAGLAVDEALNR